MARPREFDPDDAIEKAMHVFWDLGYDGASLPDLLAGMGITRGSLYKAFKDKKSLFMLVLDRYDQQEVTGAVNLLSDPEIPDGWDRIMTLFTMVTDTVAKGDRRGCLLCSAAAGPASYDPDIANSVLERFARMSAAFRRALQAAGDDPALADVLVVRGWPDTP